jgi:hypothetical protein
VKLLEISGCELELLFQGSAYQAGDNDLSSVTLTPATRWNAVWSASASSEPWNGPASASPVSRPPPYVGTRCVAAGVPLRTLQAWMGDADIKTTMVYTHYARGDPTRRSRQWRLPG